MTEDREEKRKHKRYYFLHSIQYVLDTDPESRIFKGFTVDVSEAGLCICSPDVLREGQRMVIRTELPFSLHRLTGTIRWMKQFNGYFYKAGVVFSS